MLDHGKMSEDSFLFLFIFTFWDHLKKSGFGYILSYYLHIPSVFVYLGLNENYGLLVIELLR